MNEEKQKVTIAQVDAILSLASPVTYWQGGMPAQRRDIFDDCEVVSIELDRQFTGGRPIPCIAVYVGDRVRK